MTRFHFLIILFYSDLILLAETFQTVPNIRWHANIGIASRLFAENRTPASRKRSPRPRSQRSKSVSKDIKNPDQVETWRIYGVDVSPDTLGPIRKEKTTEDAPPDKAYLTAPVLESLLSRLRIKKDDSSTDLPPQLIDARVVRRSIDARRRRCSDPKFTYVIDVDLTRRNVRECRFVHQQGRMERMGNSDIKVQSEASNAAMIDGKKSMPKVVIVGAGPAGLFCALSLALSGFKPIMLERGQPVEARGKSIGALVHRRAIDPESNFSFGEGGAGTWSDGKLTTRIGRNSEPVRYVLETLVKYGAPSRILVEGAPHLGTDNLVRLLRNMREDIKAQGGEIHFGCRASKFDIVDGIVSSIQTQSTDNDSVDSKSFDDLDAVVLATGHSARDVYEELAASGVELEAKGFAVGFRIEHPQRIINEIQYGHDWGRQVHTNRVSTDVANEQHFKQYNTVNSTDHSGNLPVPSYRLATNEAFDGESNRGAYSFCMCPGGQIVPSSTEHGELCINGMSFSKRDSLWANSACVVTVAPDDPILKKYAATHGQLAGLEFQRDMERKAWELGGGNFTCPVQRLTDFIDGRVSSSIPTSSYRLGVKPAACHDIYPKPLYNALRHAITHQFEKSMPGFLTEEALIHGVETRTSSPVRVTRDPKTLQAIGVDNLFPAGEGAGFAGGIVSAAVDGLAIAESIKNKFLGDTSNESSSDGNKFSVGFDY